MEKEITGTLISVSCPICGHHLVGFGKIEKDILRIRAYCPLCDSEFIFDEDKKIQNKRGVADG